MDQKNGALKSEKLISSGSSKPIFVLILAHNKVSSNFLSATERERERNSLFPADMNGNKAFNKVLGQRRLTKKNAQTMIVNRAKERAHLKSLLPPFDYTQWSGAKLLICHCRCARHEREKERREREMAKRFLGSRQTNSRAP